MEDFKIASHLRDVYSSFPEAGRRPLIGLTANFADGDASLRDKYYEQVVNAGGTPVLLPPVADAGVIINALDHIDGLLLTGGADINPLWTGEEPQPALHHINARRDLAELLTVRLAFNRQIPMLGICRGIQTLAVALGGKIAQDINSGATASGSVAPAVAAGNEENEAVSPSASVQPRIKHSQDAERTEPTHSVAIAPHSILSRLYGFDEAQQKAEAESATPGSEEQGAEKTMPAGHIFVNSFHHQAVLQPGPRFRVTAVAPDGIVEAIESSELKPIMGVQWHPEWLGHTGLPIFKWLVGHAGEFARAKRLHSRILTLDTHCDTPMFFPQGVRFDRRDPRILYDLHKMTDGRQDAVIMAAYLPQPKPGETFADKVDIAGILRHNPDMAGLSTNLTPSEYADLIFDKLEQIVSQNSNYISIARTPAELYEDKRLGRKSIMFGIENGLALEHNLDNVHHFAERGVVYITLCHNGDNDICDSNRGQATHGGVSSYGEEVIKAMNDEGIMVDLSHAAESSFYDALDISRVPIVCSHSCCRALCDVPRNLSDDQMRALAEKGGVAHVTFYHGFLRKNSSEASILDVMAHLEHAISVMGIDHVGVGTDFDGDGTVRGCADASELINFTIQLLRRRYSEQDIEKIWGGNWLRVMSEVQAARN